MLTLDQTLEALALALPRIVGDLAPYTLPITVTFDREIYPLLIGAIGAAGRGLSPRATEQLKTFAEGLTRTGRRSLLVRTLDKLVSDAYTIAEPWLGAEYDMTERMPADVRGKVAAVWETGAIAPAWAALFASLVEMYRFHTAPSGRVEGRYVAERVVLTRDCEVGCEGEPAIVSEIDGSTMALYFPGRHAGRIVKTGVDYAYLRSEGK